MTCCTGALVTDNTQEARDASRTVITLVHAAFEVSLDSSIIGLHLNGLNGASMTDTAHEGDLASPSTEGGRTPTGSGMCSCSACKGYLWDLEMLSAQPC